MYRGTRAPTYYCHSVTILIEEKMVRTLIGPYLITTSPSVTACSGCNMPIFAATVGGIDRHIDPTCLSWQGELVALMEGQRTYELHAELLMYRNVERIQDGTWTGAVLADHRCGRVWTTQQRDDTVMHVAMDLLARLLGATSLVPDEPKF